MCITKDYKIIQSVSRIHWNSVEHVGTITKCNYLFAVLILNIVSSKYWQSVHHPYDYINTSSIVLVISPSPVTTYHITFILNFDCLLDFILYNSVKSSNISQMPSPKYLNLRPRYATEGHINSIPS